MTPVPTDSKWNPYNSLRQEDLEPASPNAKLTKSPSKWSLFKHMNLFNFGSTSSTSQRAIKQQIDYNPYFVTSNQAPFYDGMSSTLISGHSNKELPEVGKKSGKQLARVNNSGKSKKKNFWQASARTLMRAERFEREAKENRRVRGSGKDVKSKEENYW